MPQFRADGHKPVVAGGATEAAAIFAAREARREYGRGGYCRTLRLDAWTENGLSHHYEAFIGRSVPGDSATTSGRNVWIYVTEVAEAGK